VTINYLELVQFYVLSHIVMPKSYLSGAIREERAKQITKMPKMSAFLKPANSAPLPRTTELESNMAFISKESLVFQILRIFSSKKRHASK